MNHAAARELLPVLREVWESEISTSMCSIYIEPPYQFAAQEVLDHLSNGGWRGFRKQDGGKLYIYSENKDPNTPSPNTLVCSIEKDVVEGPVLYFRFFGWAPKDVREHLGWIINAVEAS